MSRKWTKALSVLTACVMCVALAACGNKTPKVTAQFEVVAAMTLKEGFSQQITPTGVVGVTAFAYLSDDDAVATVSDDGLVTAVAPGTTTVTVAGGGVEKTVTVTVTQNTANGYSVPKLDAIGAFEDTTIEENGPAVWNYGWDKPTTEELAKKIDFAGTAADSDLVMRISAGAERKSLVENGAFTPVMIAGIDTAMTQESTPAGAHVSLYGKAKVSATAYALRVWVCSWKDAVVSGMGQFRVVAMEKDAKNLTYRTIPLTARESGTLTQDKDGWIRFEDVDATSAPAGAPANGLFEFETETGAYSIAGKEVVLSFEFAAIANTAGEEGANLQCRLGIKRFGFVETGIAVTSGEKITLGKTMTRAIECELAGDLDEKDTTFESDDVAVATVDEDGVITAVAKGTAVVTATNKSFTDTVEVTVTDNYFVIPQAATVIADGRDSVQLRPTQELGDADYAYESDRSEIATVSETGLIQGVAEGKATVTVVKGDYSAAVAVTVSPATKSIHGLDNEKLKAMAAFDANEVSIGAGDNANAFNFVSGWGATGANADKFSAGDSADAAVKVLRGVKGVNNVEENWIEMISPDNATSSAVVYTKLVVPDLPNFRAWTYAAPKNDVVSGKGRVRFVLYVPNDDYSSYTVVKLDQMTFAEIPDFEATMSADGYLTYEKGLDGFFAFSVPADVKGKTVIMAIESERVSTDASQDRFAFKRIGFIG